VARILKHPNADNDVATAFFDFDDGSVTIVSDKGPLTVEHALFLLEMVRTGILGAVQKI